MYTEIATQLFDKGKKSKYIENDYREKIAAAREAKNAKLLDRIQKKIREKTTLLFAMSLEACDLLNLPADKFHDLYFRGTHVNKANLLRGMHVEGMMKIIKFHGYSFEVIKQTAKECTVEYSLDNGSVCRYTLTIEEALKTPWIKQEFENTEEDSLWKTNPKDMLLHECVKLISKLIYRRLFKKTSDTMKNDFGLSSNHELAEEIFDEGIYDIENVDYTYLDTFQSLEAQGDEEALAAFLSNLRTKCVNKICASLDLCDALGLPKNYFYDAAKYEIYHQGDPSFNIRACCSVDVLRHFGHVIKPARLNSEMATIHYELNGNEETEHVELSILCDLKPKLRSNLEDPENVWANHTTLMLFYEALAKITKRCFAKVKVRKAKITRGDSAKRFFDEIKKYRQSETPQLDDPIEEEKKEEIIETPQKERRGLVIPQSYIDYINKKNNGIKAGLR